jgi:hypothetical protein
MEEMQDIGGDMYNPYSSKPIDFGMVLRKNINNIIAQKIMADKQAKEAAQQAFENQLKTRTLDIEAAKIKPPVEKATKYGPKVIKALLDYNGYDEASFQALPQDEKGRLINEFIPVYERQVAEQNKPKTVKEPSAFQERVNYARTYMGKNAQEAGDWAAKTAEGEFKEPYANSIKALDEYGKHIDGLIAPLDKRDKAGEATATELTQLRNLFLNKNTLAKIKGDAILEKRDLLPNEKYLINKIMSHPTWDAMIGTTPSTTPPTQVIPPKITAKTPPIPPGAPPGTIYVRTEADGSTIWKFPNGQEKRWREK